MTNWKMNLQKKYFDSVLEGTKIYEGRINDEKRKVINVGDFITFKAGDDEIVKKVDEKFLFSTFHEAFESIDLNLHDVFDIEEAIRIYYSFGFEEGEKKYGVVFFKLS